MADEVFDSTDMVRQLFREGQRVTDEAGDALPQCVIEALDMIGFAGVLRKLSNKSTFLPSNVSG